MKAGFIGLGNVGGKLAGSLLRNGIPLWIHDLDTGLVTDKASGNGREGGAMGLEDYQEVKSLHFG
jgi:3-hydroxyisobutyrate dehydrogenase